MIVEQYSDDSLVLKKNYDIKSENKVNLFFK